jgi:thiol:disulfide interchange protein
MNKKVAVFLVVLSIISSAVSPAFCASERIVAEHVAITAERQFPAVRPETSSAVAIHFETGRDWHFYASSKTAPANANLKISVASSKNFVKFYELVFPESEIYTDKSIGEKVEVFTGQFVVYIPFTVDKIDLSQNKTADAEITVNIDGAMCSGDKCIMPKFEPLVVIVKIIPDAPMTDAAFTIPQTPLLNKTLQATNAISNSSEMGIWAALSLAFIAGLILNIMPCVLPVIPLKVLSIFEQAKHNKARCIALGLAFCLGILLFFAGIAIFNIILRLGFNQAFQWGQHFRNPIFLIGMSVLMTALSLFMFGIFTVSVPSSVAGKSGSADTLAGSAAMGILAAILSTPCSFAILTAAFAWAQTQNIALASVAIMTIGVGMAAPYAILTSMPRLLRFLPKPGRWMELFKQAMGFVLLAVALWLITTLPTIRIAGVLYFSIVLAFCIWMWGGWVTFNTPAQKKIIVRIIAVWVAITAGFIFLPQQKNLVNWQSYDQAAIENAVKTQKPILIDFTADWCLTCKAVERLYLSNAAFADLIKSRGILAIKGDTTLKDNPATAALEKIYNEPGVPVVILHTPGQNEPVKLRGFEIKNIKKLLEKLPPAADTNEKKTENKH